MSAARHPMRDALDEAEEAARCLEAIADLLCPGLPLEDAGKDRLATLLGVILEKQRRALEAASAALCERAKGSAP
jgi:hypothetical protein